MADKSTEEEAPSSEAVMHSQEKVLEAANFCKLGMANELKQCLKLVPRGSVNHKDAEGRRFLHFAAAYGFESCIDVLLETPGIDVAAADEKGLLPLHYAAVHAQPMCAYNLAKAMPETCLRDDAAGQTPTDAAADCDKGEVLNAMLLACASISSKEAVASMAKLLEAGAVPDTWAPNGSSALMLAASVDCTEGLTLLIEHGATIELQDALGRTALMFAAGSSAEAAVKVLLDAGASLAARDRRNKGILDYAGDDTPVRALLEERMNVLEAAAEKLQAALLASLEAENPSSAQQQAKLKRKKDKKAKRSKKAAAALEAGKQPSSQEATDDASSPSNAVESNPEQSDEDTASQQQAASDDGTAKQDGAAVAPEEGPMRQDGAAAPVDSGSSQAASSSGEGEQPCETPFGLADETTSEDEWKVVGKAARKAAPKPASASKAGATTGAQQQHKHSQKACKRCPSLVSLTESSGTAESTESDQSVLSAVTVHHSAAQQQKPLAPASKHSGAPIASINAAHQHMSRPDAQPEANGHPAAPSSSAAGQRTWAGRVVGSMQVPQQEGPAAASKPAVSAATPDAKNAQLYSSQQQRTGAMTSEHLGASLSSSTSMYHTCTSARPAAWEPIQSQQNGIPTIPEEGVTSTPGRISHDSASGVPKPAWNRAGNQSCCAAARAQSEAYAADAIAAKQEASTLRAELHLLQAAMQRTKTAHQQEIAQLLQNAACHQAQLVREAVQAEKDAMGERLLQTFQGLKGLMHAQPFNERCNEASKDIMASLLGPQTAAAPVSLPGVHAMSQAPTHTGASNGYAAFAGDQGHQAYQDDAAAATLGASLSSLVSGLSISAPFLSEASATTALPPAGPFAASNGSRAAESFSFFST